jgi:hypothetical protein
MPSSVLIIWQCNRRWQFISTSIDAEGLFVFYRPFDDEYVVDPNVVQLRSKMRSSVEGHMFGPHLVKVRSETKSSNEGHILDHIRSKSTVRQSPPTMGIFWTTFG